MRTVDWVANAAEEIADLAYERALEGLALTREDIVAIIEEHCPFKRDTAYAPVNES
jgi:hypothetical protein